MNLDRISLIKMPGRNRYHSHSVNRTAQWLAIPGGLEAKRVTTTVCHSLTMNVCRSLCEISVSEPIARYKPRLDRAHWAVLPTMRPL